MSGGGLCLRESNTWGCKIETKLQKRHQRMLAVASSLITHSLPVWGGRTAHLVP